jgi:hypothetical protein
MGIELRKRRVESRRKWLSQLVAIPRVPLEEGSLSLRSSMIPVEQTS